MSAQITAGVMIGPLNRESTHGTPSGLPGGRLFAPSHVLVLMENSRATWIMQRCPELRRPSPTQRIQPASPAHLLAAAVLGYTTLVADASAPEWLAVEKIDDALARDIYARCSKQVYGVVTWLPGSTITESELEMAAAAGFEIARAGGG